MLIFIFSFERLFLRLHTFLMNFRRATTVLGDHWPIVDALKIRTRFKEEPISAILPYSWANRHLDFVGPTTIVSDEHCSLLRLSDVFPVPKFLRATPDGTGPMAPTPLPIALLTPLDLSRRHAPGNGLRAREECRRRGCGCRRSR